MWQVVNGTMTVAELLSRFNYGSMAAIYIDGVMVRMGYKRFIVEEYGNRRVLDWNYSSSIFFMSIV